MNYRLMLAFILTQNQTYKCVRTTGRASKTPPLAGVPSMASPPKLIGETPDFGFVLLPPKFEFQRVRLTLLSPRERIRPSKKVNREFREAAIDALCGKLPMEVKAGARQLLERFWREVHHIIPREYGGQDEGNLALMTPGDHLELHRLIDEQMVGARRSGNSREINLPVGKGDIWCFDVAIVPRPKSGLPMIETGEARSFV